MIKKIAGYTSLLLFIITCGMLGIYNYSRYSIIPTYQEKLMSMVHKRANEVNTYLNKQEENALKLSQEPSIIDALHSARIISPVQPLTSRAHSEPVEESSALKKILQQVQDEREEENQLVSTLIAAHKETMGFKNILLVDKTGTILFATTKQNLVGTNINQQQHTSSSLGKSYERASMALTNDFSDFNFNTLLQEPALFITIPILREKKFIGALSYQLDQEEIYLITNQYIGLEKTGEVTLAKKEGPNVVFLSPTRNNPDLAFKKRLLFTKPPLAIQASVLGQEGSGTAADYRGKDVVGAWKFIPKLDWGMAIKIDLDELLQPTNSLYNLFLLFLILLIMSLLINSYLFYPLIQKTLKTINSHRPFNTIPSALKSPFFIVLLIASGFTAKTMFQCQNSKSSAIEKAKNEAIKTTAKNAESIESILEKVAFVGQSIADNLRTQYLAKDDIATRIKRDIIEHRIITDITVLFAPYTYNKTTEVYVQATTNISQTENLFKTKWYTQAMEKGSTWIINPTDNEENKKPTATYACTFFDTENKPNGVIAITYSLKQIARLAEYSGIGQTGYSIIIADNGAFIFHPINALVQAETTLLQYAQSKGNEELAFIAQKVATEKLPLISSYSSESNEQFWICTHPININNWTVGSIFSQDEITISSQTVRHYHFWILIWATIAIFLLLALLCQYSLFSLTLYAVIANIILILALITSWYVIKKTTIIDRESRTIITDQSNLSKFLNNLNDDADRKHEAPPIQIPCGILLHSLSSSGADNITVSGYIWNKYNKLLDTNVIHGIDLPQATRMAFGNPVISQAGNEETMTWNIQGVLFQQQNYAQYPFDQEQIQIVLEHKDIEKNIILTPDLIAYKKISPEATPGLDKEFSVSGFTIEQAFFEYHKTDHNTNFGFKEYGKVTDDYQLIYNAIMNRNLLNPFVLYLLPLLVILFSLFTTLLVAGKNTEPLSILGGYTGLFFALIVLQRSLREQHPAGTTLYMEYAFFFTYITIIFLIIHTILMYYYKHWKTYQNNSLYFMRILFWPFQCISWLITTLIFFY